MYVHVFVKLQMRACKSISVNYDYFYVKQFYDGVDYLL